jgi:hypothetical protein
LEFNFYQISVLSESIIAKKQKGISLKECCALNKSLAAKKRTLLPLTFLIIYILIGTSCSRSLKPFNDIIPNARSLELSYSAKNKSEIKLLYVTCGMIILEKGENAIFFDPFFSYQRMRKIPFAIKSSPEQLRRFKILSDSTVNRSAVKAGFVSHTHYDHLLDLPALLADHYFPNLKTIYGSDYAYGMMYHQRRAVDFHILQNEELFDPLRSGDEYRWLKISDSISVMPILSKHAPHMFGVTVMNGRLDSSYFKKQKFTDPYATSRGSKWDTGKTYSFLVKFLNSDRSEFRIFVQTSASNEPYGLPPEGETADLAILCFASMQEVDDHPNYIMRKTRAKKLVLIHWEDFFRKPKKIDDTRIVRSTNKRLARRRLNDVKHSELNPEIVMPKPGSLIRIKY